MDIGAELTLQIIRLVQSHAGGDGSRLPHVWVFWPRGERQDWEGARALLSRLPKPVLVAPLAEPGMLGFWTLDMLDEAHRQVVGQQLSNQVQYFAGKLAALDCEAGSVQFGTGAWAHQMSCDAFLQWATEYALNLGISLGPSADAGMARVLVRPSGGGAPPLTL